jgi:subtilisin family serine protease
MTIYFMQGGQRIEVEEDDAAVTIHASSADSARNVAAMTRVGLSDAREAAPGLVRARLLGSRDESMERLRKQRVVHHVYRDAKNRDAEYLITDTFYIKFKSGVPRERIADYFSLEHLEVVTDLGESLFVVRVTDQTKSNPLRVANRAHAMSDVEYAEPNMIREVQRSAPFIPADHLFAQQWHLHSPNAGPDLLAGAGIFAPDAWEVTRGSRDIVIAVADDAFDITHPDFGAPGKIAGRWNLTPTSNDFAVDSDVSPRAGDYHGTPCAGVALSEADGRGVVGVAPGCSFLAVRFSLSMSELHFLKMFERISRVADVVSCSWGYGPGNFPMSSGFRDRIASIVRTGGRRGKGLVICVAAGNQNCPVQDLANTKRYQYFEGNVLRSYSGPINRWLAAHPDVITVSACTSLKKRSAYSSWGRRISVCAPSDNWDDLRRVNVAGRGVVTTDNEGFGAGTDFTTGSRFTAQFGGTSSATPTVAGVAGLVLTRNPALSALEVKALLERTADKDLDFASETPVNEPGTFTDGFSLWFGHGKVNAAKAVRAALPANTSQTVTAVNSTEVAIPDRDQTVSSRVQFDALGTIADVRVSVDIRHTYIGDLVIEIVSPGGGAVTLHNHDGGGTHDLRKTYSVSTTPALQAFLGAPLRGTWELRVTDSWKMDEGRLVSFRVDAKVTNQQPQPALSPKARAVDASYVEPAPAARL